VYEPDQTKRHAKELRDAGAEVLFDPGFYVPNANRLQLRKYPYWGSAKFRTATFGAAQASALCGDCIAYQLDELNVSRVLLPGRFTNNVNEAWLTMHHAFAQEGASVVKGDRPLYSTLALGPDVIADESSLNDVLDEFTGYPVDGIYLVYRHPGNAYLIQDEIFLLNLLNMVLTLRLAGKDVLVGYANQQTIALGAAGLESIASGNFRNTRFFDPDMYNVLDEPERRRSTWYYHTASLSEFKVTTLALAYRLGLKKQFRRRCVYCRPLLEASNPAAVRWGEPDAFRHYLLEIGRQWQETAAGNADGRYRAIMAALQAAHASLAEMAAKGFLPGERSFAPYADPTSAAIHAFRTLRARDLGRLH